MAIEIRWSDEARYFKKFSIQSERHDEALEPRHSTSGRFSLRYPAIIDVSNLATDIFRLSHLYGAAHALSLYTPMPLA